MAKIRTIKPEFWESEQVGECHPMARLLFICLLNFCDDGGNYPASVKAMKRNAFGYDEVTYSQVDAWMQELISNGLVVTYEAEGKTYWHVTGFSKHQTIGRPFLKHPPFKEQQSNAQTMPEQCSDNVQALHEQCSSNAQTMPEQCSSIAGKGKGKETERKGKGKDVVVLTDTGGVPIEPDPIAARSGLLARAFHSEGIKVNPGDPRLRKWAENGLPVSTVHAVIDRARRRKPGQTFRFEYFIPVIEDLETQADGLKAGSATRPPGKKETLEEAIIKRHAAGEVVDVEVKEVLNGLTC